MSHSILVNCCCFSHTTEGDLRLVGGDSDNEGHVEVYHRGRWGIVCGDFWDLTDANVVCHQLGYSRATSAYTYARIYFGSHSGPIYYDDVACTGNETRLADCSHRGIGIHNCGIDRNAGVGCALQGEMKMCLFNLNSPVFSAAGVAIKLSVAFAQAVNDINEAYI